MSESPRTPGFAVISPVQLAEYGQLLDDVDAGARVPASAYRKAAVYALSAIRAHPEHAGVIAICALSPALTELRDGVVLERQLAAGHQDPALAQALTRIK